jgi:hypothetical protein
MGIIVFGEKLHDAALKGRHISAQGVEAPASSPGLMIGKPKEPCKGGR